MTLAPEERLALTAALDLSLDDEVRARALRDAVAEGLAALEQGKQVSLESKKDLDTLLNDCLEEARRQVNDSVK